MVIKMDMDKVKTFVKTKLQDESSGHDYLHALRVFENAKKLLKEDLDTDVVLISSLIHDLIDYKLDKQFQVSKDSMIQFLRSLVITENQINHIIDIIENISFSKGCIPKTEEGKIVQDADRLDALGAIGIARTFSYGGSKGRLIYGDPNELDSVSHFYQKLLKLEERMNTEQGKLVAKERTEYMKEYLKQLYSEIGEDYDN